MTFVGVVPDASGGVALAGIFAYVKFRLRTPSNECNETVEFIYARWVAFCVAYGWPCFGIGATALGYVTVPVWGV